MRSLLSAVVISTSTLLMKWIPITFLPFEYFPDLFLQLMTERYVNL